MVHINCQNCKELKDAEWKTVILGQFHFFELTKYEKMKYILVFHLSSVSEI